ncbi:uncharacterized protein LOC117103130 [Anneissia japonica]|uniref:uncharacterized protein LOC117103130 n=1 Tax=Anneissia japonica TaxID=1529436 RepID=UPI0014256C3F|nr:uncharacterized protein LOC117103130 [Anneissia japonica]
MGSTSGSSQTIFIHQITLLVLGIISFSALSETCTSPMLGLVEGNIRLGLLFPFSENEDGFCSSESVAENIAFVEAAIYAVKNLPEAARIPGVTIGLEAFDSCSSPAVGLQSVLSYIDNPLYHPNGTLCRDVILRPGIIGPLSDDVAQATAPLLSYQNIPMISYETTSSILTENNEKRSSFLRLSPSYKTQVQVLVDLLWSLRWEYIGVMYPVTMETTLEELQTKASDAGICLAKKVRIPSQSPVPYVDGIIDIIGNSDIKVVVLLLEDDMMLTSVMEAIMRVGDAASDLHWVSNIEPTSRLMDIYQDAIRGLISIKYVRDINDDFKTYLSSLNPSLVSPEENPWFANAWEIIKECDLSQDGRYGVPCNLSATLSSESFDKQDVLTSNVIDAVFVYAEALARLHQELCGSFVGICERFSSKVGGRLLDELLVDEFTGALNQTIVFNDNGGPMHVDFEIANIHLYNNSNATIVKIGAWDSDSTIELNTEVIQLWTSSEELQNIPISTCPEPCKDPACFSSTGSAESFATDGDVVIGGMFSIHDVDCIGFKTFGFLRMQAMLYAIQSINDDPTILPNVTIGAEAFDTCSDTAVTGKQTFKFAASFPSTDDGLFISKGKNGKRQYAVGVIGSDRNDITANINQHLTAIEIVQIGYSSTPSSNELINFYHVVPSTESQANVIIDILIRVEYKYIQTIESKYAKEAVDTLKYLSSQVDISVANSIVVEEDTSFDNVIHRLLTYPTANVIVVFLEAPQVNQVLEALDRAGLQQQFQIIASDEWGLDTSTVDGIESVTENSITISPKSMTIPGFESYFTGLQPENAVDPWFTEFWMDRYKCQLPGQPILYDESCSGSNALNASDALSSTIASVVDAVYVIANALDSLVRDKCPEEGNICSDIASVSIDEWLSYVDGTAFESSRGSGVSIDFDDNREVVAVYDVKKYQGLNSDFGYQTIGSWEEGTGLVGLDVTEFKKVASECLDEMLPCSGQTPQLSIIEGDITLIALFSAHMPGDSALRCGALSLEQVVAVEALNYALEEVNKDSNILPELTLGATIADYCGSSLLALDQFVNVVSNATRYGQDFALVGPVDTEIASTVVLDAITPLGFTIVSPSVLEGGSASLAPYHVLTKPSPQQVVSTYIELVHYFGWTYIAILFTDSASYRYQQELFIKELQSMDVCVAVTSVMPVGGDRLKMDGLLSQISTTAGVGVAFAFLSDDHFSLLLESKTEFGSNVVNIMWVGSFPSTQDLATFENSNIATLSTRQYEYDLAEFQTYLTNLSPAEDQSTLNPWFREYFETVANCTIQNDYKSSVPICEAGLTLGGVDESRLHISNLVADIIKSVYAIAQAAHDRLSSLCVKNSDKICRQFTEHDPIGIYNAIANVEIHPSMSDEPIQFKNGIVNEKIIIVNQIGGQDAKEVQVGNFFSGTLTLDGTNIKSYDVNGNIQQGVRSSKCPIDSCTCNTSPDTKANEPSGSETLEWNVEGYWVTIVLTTSGTCSVLMLLLASYFIYHRKHKVVVDASLSLSLLLIIGLVLMYAMNLAFMVTPTVIICGVRRVGVSLVYGIVFSALSVKIIRINRLRRRLVPEEPIGFTGGSSQTFFFFVFLMADIVLVVEWLILENPSTILNPSNQIQCSFDKVDLVVSLTYAYNLIVFALIVSSTALNSSSINCEGRYIFLACLSTICCVITWTCVYVFANDTELYEIPSVCVGLTVNATLILVAILFPKLYALSDALYLEKSPKNPPRNAKMGQAYANTALHTNEEEALTTL